MDYVCSLHCTTTPLFFTIWAFPHHFLPSCSTLLPNSTLLISFVSFSFFITLMASTYGGDGVSIGTTFTSVLVAISLGNPGKGQIVGYKHAIVSPRLLPDGTKSSYKGWCISCCRLVAARAPFAFGFLLEIYNIIYAIYYVHRLLAAYAFHQDVTTYNDNKAGRERLDFIGE